MLGLKVQSRSCAASRSALSAEQRSHSVLRGSASCSSLAAPLACCSAMADLAEVAALRQVRYVYTVGMSASYIRCLRKVMWIHDRCTAFAGRHIQTSTQVQRP